MRYRTREQLYCAMLEAAIGTATSTQLMYRSFISYVQLKEYLANLTDARLLERVKMNGNHRVFRTTEKGIQYIRTHKMLEDSFK